jgi:hypothetical protein
MYKALTVVLSTAVILLITVSPALAAATPPANDTFASATQIAYLPFEDGYVDNSAATVDVGEFDPSCTSVDSTVWYKIVPSSDYTIRVRAIPVTSVDVGFAVYEGTSYGSLTELACADMSGIAGEEIARVALQSGHTYVIQVGGYRYDATTGQFTVKVRREPPPANDNFNRAAAVALGSISQATTHAATMQPGEPDMCGATKTVWYRFTPATTRTIVANTVGSGFDTVINVYVGSSLDSLQGVTCNDDRGMDLTSKVKFRAHAGTTYYFQVGGYAWSGAAGELVFRLKKA